MSDVGQEVQSLLGFSQSTGDVTSSALSSSRLDTINEQMDVDDVASSGLFLFFFFNFSQFSNFVFFSESQQTLDAERFFESWQRNIQQPSTSPPSAAGVSSSGAGGGVMADLQLSESDSDYDDVT